MQHFKTILLAYDGSDQGRIALQRSLALLQGPGVAVTLLAVVPLTGAVAAAEGFYTESMYQSERERVERRRRGVGAHDGPLALGVAVVVLALALARDETRF